jgi:hypothetical protein
MPILPPSWKPPPDSDEMWKALAEASTDPDRMDRIGKFDRQHTVLRFIIPLALALGALVAMTALMVLR